MTAMTEKISITLKLFAGLSEYLPPDADGNAMSIKAPADATPHGILAQCGLPREQVRVIMVNGEYVAPKRRDAPLRDGDVMAVWPVIQGG